MKLFKLHNIRLMLILGVLFFLVGFANHRQSQKPITSIKVELLDASKLFITETEVEQLLKDALESSSALMNESHIATLEDKLDTNEMIKTSEAFYSLDGTLSAKVIQREPIARVNDNGFYYLDEDGLPMPLSPNYSSRVPLVLGVGTEELEDIYPLLMKIRSDDFFKKHIIAIQKKSSTNYVLKVRGWDYEVNFGQISYLDKKFTNYKVFYTKAIEYKKLKNYKRIDLQFGNQVVCTTK